MIDRDLSKYQRCIQDVCLERLYNHCVRTESSISDVLGSYARRTTNLELITLDFKDNYTKLLFMAYRGTCKEFNFNYKVKK